MSHSSPVISRRRLLQVSGVGAATLALGISAPDSAIADPSVAEQLFGPGDSPYGLGVASGAPRPDGAVLWTRLAPEPLAADGHGGMPLQKVAVQWEVATDADFRSVVQQGRALAQPDLAHAIHPRVSGLKPATPYFYRFRSGGSVSPVGRFKTLPAESATPEQFSFGVVSCQAWYHGHFTAYKHLVDEPDLDLVLFVGDYIYEYGITAANLWREGVEVAPAHAGEGRPGPIGCWLSPMPACVAMPAKR